MIHTVFHEKWCYSVNGSYCSGSHQRFQMHYVLLLEMIARIFSVELCDSFHSIKFCCALWCVYSSYKCTGLRQKRDIYSFFFKCNFCYFKYFVTNIINRRQKSKRLDKVNCVQIIMDVIWFRRGVCRNLFCRIYSKLKNTEWLISRGAKYYDLCVIITHIRPILRCYGQLFFF